MYAGGPYLIALIKTDTSGNVLWAKTYGNGYIAKVKTAADGGFLACGSIPGNNGFVWNFLLRTDANGNLQWKIIINNSPLAWDVVELPSGQIALLHGDQGTHYISVFTGTGTHLWSKSYTLPAAAGGDWFGRRLLLLPDGFLIVTVSSVIGSDDAVAIKTDFNGNVIWAKAYGAGGWDSPRDAVLCKDGSIAITGAEDSFGGGSSDHFILKIDGNGNFQWVRSYGDGVWSRAQAIVQTYDNGFLITGNRGNPDDGGTLRIYMVKTDSTGNALCQTHSATWTTVNLSIPVGSFSPDITNDNTQNNETPSVTNVSVTTNYICIECINFAAFKQCPSGVEVQFIDSSLCKPTSWLWDFGDGTTSSEPNPLHVYPAPGVYTVKLITNVSITGCSDTLTKQITITSIKAADFAAQNVCDGTAVTFTDQSSGAIQYLWEFGDGSTASIQSPAHLYSQPNTYYVTLHITTSEGCKDTEVKVISVFPVPIANFTFSNVCQNVPATFTNNSTIAWGSMTWQWDFGDGFNSTIQNPVHQYSAPGTYPVSLIATSDKGCKDTAVQNISIYPVPVASFTYQDKCQYDSIPFYNQSSIQWGSMSYVWDFGDGQQSTDINPKHLYSSPGNYTVVLTATSDMNCVSTISKIVSVHPVPTASFTYNNVCDGTPVTFINNSTVAWGILSYEWSFGDGSQSNAPSPSHVYPGWGTYVVKLKATSDKGCVDSIQNTVVVNPVPQANFSATNVCLYDQVTFTNNTTIASGTMTYEWYFGDGSSSNNTSPTHQYSLPNTYMVTLKAISDSGCVATIAKPVQVYPVPVANFAFANQCEGTPVLFQNTSTGAVSFLWDFGDGNQSSLMSPIHTYQQEGTYQVHLQVTSTFSCIDDTTATIIINPVPDLNFTFSNKCVYDTVYFTNLSSIPYGSVNYIWYFGDGNSMNSSDAFHKYSNYGTYNVTLVGISDSGCIASITSVVEVYPQPVASINAGNSCLNAQPINFSSNSTIVTGSIAGHYWDFGDGSVSGLSSPSHTYSDTGAYTLTYIVTSDKGCRDTLQTVIYVYPPPVADFTGEPLQGCPPLCVNLQSTSTPYAPSIDSTIWMISSGDVLSGTNIQNCFIEPGYYSVTLIVKNSYGCYDTIKKQNIIWVYPEPEAGFSVNSIEMPIHEPVIRINDLSVGAIATAYFWGDNTSDTAFSPAHTYQDTGKFIIQQVVWNQYNCRDTYELTVFIRPEVFIWVPNAFTPNGDGINDTFMWKGFGLKEDEFYYMKIYDRWGQLIWETTKFEGWDGSHKSSGKICPEGVYIFLIQVRDINGKVHRFNGTVSLLH